MGTWLYNKKWSCDVREYDTYNQLVASIIIVWGVLDTVTTYVGVGVYGTTEHEVNPIAKYLIDFHPGAFFIAKLATMFIVGVVMVYGRTHIEDVILWKPYLIGVVLVGIGVISVNMFTISFGIAAKI
jgi:uncharacterized membrane protein